MEHLAATLLSSWRLHTQSDILIPRAPLEGSHIDYCYLALGRTRGTYIPIHLIM